MVKTGDFKTTKGVVQLNVGKGGGEAAEPPKDNDVKDYIDFVGEQHMNFGECDSGDDQFDDESDLESSFTFLGINFSEVGEESPPVEDPQENSTQIGVTLNTHERKVRFKEISGRKQLTLQWWKIYLDSCATYHTFFVKEFLKNVVENKGTMNGNCNAGETKITKRGYFGKLGV